MAPAKIGRFDVVKEVSTSDTGAVFKATDPKTGQTVALRTLSLEALGSTAQETVQRCKQEARSAASLQSPNIAAVYGAGEAEGLFFLVLEYVEGIGLKKRLDDKNPLTLWEAIDLSRQICGALDHASSKGVAHRSFEPGNIIEEWDGTLKILDFGVARAGGSAGTVNTLRYFSPEQVKGEPLDGRSNLFSWAAILYELMTTHVAFPGDTPDAVRQKILEGTPAAPNSINPKIDAAVSEVLLKSLSKNPADRYQRGEELIRELERCKQAPRVAPEPVVARAAALEAAAPGLSTGSFARTEPSIQAPPAPSPAAPMAAVSTGSMSASPASPATASQSMRAAAPVMEPPPAPRPPAPRPTPPPETEAAGTVYQEPKGAAPRKPVIPTKLSLGGAGKLDPRIIAIVAGAVVLVLIGIAIGMYRSKPKPEEEITNTTPSVAASQPAETAQAAPAQPEQTQEPGAAPDVAASAAKQPKKRRATLTPVQAPPVAVTGDLMISSNPDGASVQLDGRGIGVTPYTATALPLGNHTITVAKSGYSSETRTVQVTAGNKTVVALNLTEAKAILAVSSDPSGAAITLDGKDTGKVTPAQLSLDKGSHTLSLRRPGYFEATSTTSATPGQNTNVNLQLKAMGNAENIKTSGGIKKIFGGGGVPKGMGAIQVKCRPKGVHITVNGRAMEKAAPTTLILEPGNYQITLTLEGYKPITKMVTVEDGTNLTIDESLEQ